MTIDISLPGGLPVGTYDVFYYRLHRGDLVPRAGYDRDVSDGYVGRIKVGQREAAKAVCKSQPGGMWICGGRQVAEAVRSWGLA